MRKSFLKVLAFLLVMVLALPLYNQLESSQTETAFAQGPNLLQSPQMTAGNWYTRDGIDGQMPGGWDIWANGQPPASDYNQFLPYTRSAPGSWELRGGYVAWTAGAFQRVNNVQVGATYRFTIYMFTWTCNDLVYSCTDEVGRSSDLTYGSPLRVGIDPTGGTDGSASTVLWGSFGTSNDRFSAFTVDAVAESTSITVFTYNSVTQPAPALRQLFLDDASLVQLPEGEGVPLNGDGSVGDGSGGDPALVAPPETVPFVTPQAAQPDGSVVHTVQDGDTVNSIYIAYRYLGLDRDSFYALNGWEEPPGFIIPGEQILILPPGSVDPTTGQLLTTGGSTTTSGTTGTGSTGTTGTGTTGTGTTGTGTGSTGTGSTGAGTGTTGTGTTGTGTGSTGTGGTGAGTGAGDVGDGSVPSTIQKGG